MKILVVNSLDYRYGSTYRTRMLVASLRRIGYPVKYVESNYQYKNPDVISVRQSDNIIGYCLASIYRFNICLTEDYDLLLLQNFSPLNFFCLIAAKIKMRSIIVDWDAFEFLFQKTIFRKVLTCLIEFICPYFTDYILSPSSYLINHVKKRGIRNIAKVPQCIDTSLFDPTKFKSKELREKMGWHDKVIICYLCAFNPGGIRDLENILKIFRNVMLRNPKVFLLLIGEGILGDKVREMISQYGINNYYIIGIREQEKVVECLNTADICLVFLRNDLGSTMRTSIKLLTYLSMNKIVIGYIVGESKDTFGKYVILPSPEIEVISDNILEVIEKDDFINTSRDFIVENYDSNVLSTYLKDIITRIHIK